MSLLTSGTRLGPYQIESAIGAGGMGEIYRAKDTRLDRIVAIKVLPERLAADSQFRERFEREARSISALNHPNICTLFDVGEIAAGQADGPVPGDGIVSYLVMEYLEGDSLAARLAKGPLPLTGALKIASEIASALDKAHRSGIVHRDLKPGNVMLTKAGAKLLDFGLAKIGPIGALPGAGQSALRTMTAPPGARGDPLTAQGTILGTFQYMAPEQIEGGEADARTDIFAFGCVLYEMLTGRKAFQGVSQAGLLGAILKDDTPPVSQFQQGAPPALDYLVRTCLAKDPDNRFQTAHDLLLQLRWIAEGGGAPGSPVRVDARPGRGERTLWGGLVVAAAVVTGVATWWVKPPPPTRYVTRFQHLLPEGQTLGHTDRHAVAISPDGTKVAYVANQRLYLRAVDQLEAQPIRGTDEDPRDPVFSPDGQSIAYFVSVGGPASAGVGGGLAASLKKIPVVGGVSLPLARLDDHPDGASWRNGTILFGENVAGKVYGIRSVSDKGGEPTTLIAVDGQTERATQPQLLDDGRHVVFTVLAARAGADDEGQIVVQSVDGGQRTVLVNGGADPHLLATGQLVYIHNSTVLAVPFDAKRLDVAREQPVPVIDGVSQTGSTGQFAVSDDGTLVYQPGTVVSVTGSRALVVVDRQGHEQPISASVPPGSYLDPRLSPDGTKLAVSSGRDIWIWTFAKEMLTNLTFDAAAQFNPAWMPDGQQVVFDSSEGGLTRILRKAVDGTGVAEVLNPGPAGYPEAIAPDSTRLTYHTPGNTLMLLPLDPGGVARPLVQTQGQTMNGEISPDGRWIAYQSNDSGRFEIYVRPFPKTETGYWQVSSDGGTCPLWARNSGELFFISGPPSQLMAVSVQPGPVFTYGKPAPLFPATPYLTNVARNYDVSPDGARFIMVKSVISNPSVRPSLVFVSHWIDDVRRRMRQ